MKIFILSFSYQFVEDYPKPNPEELRKIDKKETKSYPEKEKKRLGYIQGHLRKILVPFPQKYIEVSKEEMVKAEDG